MRIPHHCRIKKNIHHQSQPLKFHLILVSYEKTTDVVQCGQKGRETQSRDSTKGTHSIKVDGMSYRTSYITKPSKEPETIDIKAREQGIPEDRPSVTVPS